MDTLREVLKDKTVETPSAAEAPWFWEQMAAQHLQEWGALVRMFRLRAARNEQGYLKACGQIGAKTAKMQGTCDGVERIACET